MLILTATKSLAPWAIAGHRTGLNSLDTRDLPPMG
jgi:hypothetical protein